MAFSRYILIILTALLPSLAFGQGAVQQSGVIVPGNFTKWSRNGVISDSGVSAITTPSFSSPSPIGNVTPNTGAFTTLTASGTTTLNQINQTITSVLSGGASPWGGSLGFNQSLSYTGTVTNGIPLNLGSFISPNTILIRDDIFYTYPGAGGKTAFSVNMFTTSGQGSPTAFLAQSYFRPLSGYTDAVGGTYISPLQTNLTVGGNITGATSGFGGKGFAFGGGTQVELAAGIFAAQLNGLEVDFRADVTATARRSEGLKIVNQSLTPWTPTEWGAMLSMSSNGGLMPFGITFGSIYTGFHPVSAIGTMIFSYPGTAANGIDFSQVTLTDDFLRGPNGFRVRSFNRVHTDGILTPANLFSILNTSGNGIADFQNNGVAVNSWRFVNAPTGTTPVLATLGSDATVGMTFRTSTGAGDYKFWNSGNDTEFMIAGIVSAISYPKFTPAASGAILMDVGGTAAPITIGGTAATAVNVGRAAGALGFYGATAVAKQTGVAVTAAAIHASLVNLGLIAP